MRNPASKFFQKVRGSDGFSLVEVIVAILILALAGTVILNSLSTNSQVNRKSTDKSVITESLNAAVQKIIQSPISLCSTIASNPPNPYRNLTLPTNVRVLRVKALSPSTNVLTECYRDTQELGTFTSTWAVSTGTKESYQEITLCYKETNSQLCTEPTTTATQTSDGRSRKFIKFDNISPLYLVKSSTNAPLNTSFPNLRSCSVTSTIIAPDPAITGYLFTATSSDVRYLTVGPVVSGQVVISPTGAAVLTAPNNIMNLSILLTATDPSGNYTESVIPVEIGVTTTPCP